mgnify:CR=1 FL=1
MATKTQISFMIEGQNYGLDIMSVRAIEKCENISPVIGAPSYIKGVLNLRGELIPVYSIRNKFALPERPYDEVSKLIIVMLDQLPVAIEVDSVVGIINIEETKITERPNVLNNSSTGFIGHVAELDDKKIIVLISLKHLVTDEERQLMLDMLKPEDDE